MDLWRHTAMGGLERLCVCLKPFSPGSAALFYFAGAKNTLFGIIQPERRVLIGGEKRVFATRLCSLQRCELALYGSGTDQTRAAETTRFSDAYSAF